MYDVLTTKKSSLNENRSFHWGEMGVFEVNKLSGEGNFMTSVVSTFLRWGIICCCVRKPIRVRTGGFLFRSSSAEAIVFALVPIWIVRYPGD